MLSFVRVFRLVHVLLPVPYTPRVALFSTCPLHPLSAELAWMLWLCGCASAHMSSDWCYPLCALVTLVLRLVGFGNPCRLGTGMVSLVRVFRLVHVLLPVPYTPRVALFSTCPLHPLSAELAWMLWLCGCASAHMSSDWCYPLCALVTLVLRLVGFGNPCRLGTGMVSLVRVFRLVHVLLPMPYTPRVALFSTCPLHPLSAELAWMLWLCGCASAHMSLDWCYPLCALVTLVLRLVGFGNPCRLGTGMVSLVRVFRLVHVLLPVPYTPRVALFSTCPLHPLSAELAWMLWLCGCASAHMSSDWCYPLCALVTLVLRLVGFGNPCRLGTGMVSLVRVFRLVHVLLPVPYTPRVALFSTCPLHPLSAELAWMLWLCGCASAHMSSDWCYPLCALVTLVLVSLVGVIRLVHILLPVPYTHRVARVRYIHALRRLTTIVDSGLALTVTWWGTGGVQAASLYLRPLHLPFSSKSRAGLRFREGEVHPVPHGQCFMPVRVPSGIGGWCIIVLPSLSYFYI